MDRLYWENQCGDSFSASTRCNFTRKWQSASPDPDSLSKSKNNRPPVVNIVRSRLENVDLHIDSVDKLADHIWKVYKREGLSAVNSIVDKLANLTDLIPTIALFLLRDEDTSDWDFRSIVHTMSDIFVFLRNHHRERRIPSATNQASASSGLNDYSRRDPLLHTDSVHISLKSQARESTAFQDLNRRPFIIAAWTFW